MPAGADGNELDFGVSGTPSAPFAIEYSLQVLEELRVFVEEGYKIPHGGAEVGALLLGALDGAVVRVLEWRPIECEHARGPRFVLSGRDLDGLGRLLESAASDPALAGLVPVGWLRAHTRGGLSLSGEDIAIHNRYFPAAHQAAVLLTMAADQPARAGFFFRGPSGGFASPVVIRVEPDPAMLLRPPRATSAPAHVPEPPKSGFRWQLLAVVAAGLAIAVAVLIRPLWMPSLAGPVALRVQDQLDQIVIRWDHAAPSVLRAGHAVLEITDGPLHKRVELNREETRRGSVTYARTGGDVAVRLVLFESGRPVKQESVRFLGPPLPPAQLASPAPGPAALTAESARLREELRAEQARSGKLRESLRQLEIRLKRQ